MSLRASCRRLATVYSLSLGEGSLPSLLLRPERPTNKAAICLTPNLHATDDYSRLLHYVCEASGYTFLLPSFAPNTSVPVDEDELQAFRESFFDAESMPLLKQRISEHLMWLKNEAAASVVSVVGIDSGADVVVESSTDLINTAATAPVGLSLVIVDPVVAPAPSWMQRVVRRRAGAFVMSSDRSVVSAYRPAASQLAAEGGTQAVCGVGTHSGKRGVFEATADAFSLGTTTDALVGLLHCLSESATLAGRAPSEEAAKEAVEDERFAVGMEKLRALRALRGAADWKSIHVDSAKLAQPRFEMMFPEPRYNPRPPPVPQTAM